MPLFKAKIKVVTYKYVPVFANSRRNALRYLNTIAEWMGDGALDGLDHESIEVDGVKEVTSPAEAIGWRSFAGGMRRT